MKTKKTGVRGRKPKLLNFNFGKGRAFIVPMVFKRYANTKNRISKVAINVKLGKMVLAGEMFVVGKAPASGVGRGRPFKQYILRSAMTKAQLAKFARA